MRPEDPPRTPEPGHRVMGKWWPSLSVGETRALVVILLIAGIVRFIGIGDQSFWVDEAASWRFSQMPLGELWGKIPYEPHPPLYYTLLKFWSYLFGAGEAALRSLSALANVATVIFVFLTGRTAAPGRDGFWLGLIGATVFALHPVQIYFAREARSYALLTLGAAMTLYALTWWLQHPRGLSVPLLKLARTEGKSFRIAVLCICGSLLAFWTHHTAVLLLGSVMTLAAILIVFRQSDRRWALLNLIAFGIVILLLWLPSAWLLMRSLNILQTANWLHAPSLRDVIDCIDYLIGATPAADISRPSAKLLVTGIVGLIAMAGAAALVRLREWRSALLLSAAAALPILLALIASLTVTPIFLPRPLVWVEIGYILLIAASVLWARSTAARSCIAGVIIVPLLCLSLTAQQHKEPWREIVGLLAKESARNDLVIAWYNYAQVPLAYYHVAERVRGDRLRLWQDQTAAYPTMLESLSSRERLPFVEVMARVQEAERTHRTIWLIVHGSTRDETVVGISRYLDSVRGTPRIEVDFQTTGVDAQVRVTRYSPASASNRY